jgi:hypothetical protein
MERERERERERGLGWSSGLASPKTGIEGKENSESDCCCCRYSLSLSLSLSLFLSLWRLQKRRYVFSGVCAVRKAELTAAARPICFCCCCCCWCCCCYTVTIKTDFRQRPLVNDAWYITSSHYISAWIAVIKWLRDILSRTVEDVRHEDSLGLSAFVVHIFATRWQIYCCPPKKEGNRKEP